MLAEKEAKYQAFRSRRKEMFKICPPIKQGQTQASFAMDIANQSQSSSERAAACELTRAAGMAFLDFMMGNLVVLQQNYFDYLRGQGLSEIVNVYIHTAALQAIYNRKGAMLVNWLQVAALNKLDGRESESLTSVLALIGPYREKVTDSESDPFPTADTNDLILCIAEGRVSAALAAAAAEVRRLLGNAKIVETEAAAPAGPVGDPAFVTACAKLRQLEPPAQGETEAQYVLRVAAKAAPHFQSGDSPLVEACDNLRTTGRMLLDQLRYSQDLCEKAPKVFARLYVYTAPFDAANWRKMKPACSAVSFKSWLEVAAVNRLAGEDWILNRRAASLGRADDAYGQTLFAEVDGMIRGDDLAAVPPCVGDSARRVKALYGQ